MNIHTSDTESILIAQPSEKKRQSSFCNIKEQRYIDLPIDI